jgi:CTP:molybdopterin cytidylyltransferase MocA
MNSAAAIILAAGASSRLGEPKQLALLAGEQLLERAVRVAGEAGCEPIVVVLGANAEQISARCSLASAIVVMNKAWAEGMATSIRCGISALPKETRAAILMTCDQPAVTSSHLRSLMEQCKDEPVASSYAGREGVPACFPASHFSELMRLEGDAGARYLLRAAPSVELPGGELDIDTPEALTSARRLYEI